MKVKAVDKLVVLRCLKQNENPFTALLFISSNNPAALARGMEMQKEKAL